ncbi:MAG: hypothetical protein M0T74_16505 [Desulfitobacterium hafniense]|nr:hypothetical protein [Desulfitobacterium hafniense]
MHTSVFYRPQTKVLIRENNELKEKVKKQQEIIKRLRSKEDPESYDFIPVQSQIRKVGTGYVIMHSYALCIDKDQSIEKKALDKAAKLFGNHIDCVFFHKKFGWLARLKATPIKPTKQLDQFGLREVQ